MRRPRHDWQWTGVAARPDRASRFALSHNSIPRGHEHKTYTNGNIQDRWKHVEKGYVVHA